jgi:hypothetical protein
MCFFIRKSTWNKEYTSYQVPLSEDGSPEKKRQRVPKEADESSNHAIPNTSEAIVEFVGEVLNELIKRLQVISSEDIASNINEHNMELYASTLVKIFDVAGVISNYCKELDPKMGIPRPESSNNSVLVIQPTIPLSVLVGLYQAYEDFFWTDGRQSNADSTNVGDNHSNPVILMQRYCKHPMGASVVRDLVSEHKTTYPGSSLIHDNMISRTMFIQNLSSCTNVRDQHAYFLSEDITYYIKKCNRRNLMDDVRTPLRLIKDIMDHITLSTIIENARLTSLSVYKDNAMVSKFAFSKWNYDYHFDFFHDAYFTMMKGHEIRQILGLYDLGMVLPTTCVNGEQIQKLRESYDTAMPESTNSAQSSHVKYPQSIEARNAFVRSFVHFPAEENEVMVQNGFVTLTEESTLKNGHWGDMKGSSSSSTTTTTTQNMSLISPDEDVDSMTIMPNAGPTFIRDGITATTTTQLKQGDETHSLPSSQIDLEAYYRTIKAYENKKSNLLKDYTGVQTRYDMADLIKRTEDCFLKQPNILATLIHFVNSNFMCWGTKKPQRTFERCLFPFFLFIINITKSSTYENFTTLCVHRKILVDKYHSQLRVQKGIIATKKVQAGPNMVTATTPSTSTTQKKGSSSSSVASSAVHSGPKKRKRTENETGTEAIQTYDIPQPSPTSSLPKPSEVSIQSVQRDETEKVLQRQLAGTMAKRQKITDSPSSLNNNNSNQNDAMVKLMILVFNEVASMKGLMVNPASVLSQQPQRQLQTSGSSPDKNENKNYLIPAPTYLEKNT